MKKLLAVLVLIGLALVGGAVWINQSSRTVGETPFTTVAIERGTIAEIINATGILQPREITAVGSAMSGEVVKIYPNADFNHTVQKGEPLLELDARAATLKRDQAKLTVMKAQADAAKARSAIEAARSGLNRVQAAFDKSLAQQSELNQVKYLLKTAEGAQKTAEIQIAEAKQGLEAAQLALALMTVRAPASGIIIDRKVVMGQLVAPPASAQLFVIASDLADMQLNAQVAEGDVSRVTKGLSASFTVYAYTDNVEPFQGTVEYIRPMSTNVTGPMNTGGVGAVFYTTVIRAQNRPVPHSKGKNEWMLRPGMTATVDIQRRKHTRAIKIPTAALNFQLDEHYQSPEAKEKLKMLERLPNPSDWRYVWVLKDKKPWPIFVRIGGKNGEGETGIRDGQFTEVLQWDPEETTPESKADAELPQAIIAAPPATKPGWFDKPTGIKFS